MPSPELIVFDCDGVLVDSEVVAARVEAEILSEAGYPIAPEDVASRFSGLKFADMLLKIEEESSIPFQASLIDQAEKRIDRKLQREARAIDGAGRAAASIGLPRCICSNSSMDRVRMTLARSGLLALFEPNIFVAEETPTKKAKPAPDVFLYAAKKMNADPARSIVVEDSVHGVTGARTAGMRVIGFTGASHSFPGHADHLTEAGAETVIRRLQDLGAVIGAMSEWAETS